MNNQDSHNIAVREADGQGDLEAVRRILESYATEFGPTVRENLRLQKFDEELAGLPGRYAAPTGSLLVATVDGLAAGCVALRDLGEGVCEMKRLYVASEFRTLGLGRRLVAAILDRAKVLGHRRMVLDSTEEMSPALKLYRSFGFLETQPYGVSRHAYYFEKDLTSDGG